MHAEKKVTVSSAGSLSRFKKTMKTLVSFLNNIGNMFISNEIPAWRWLYLIRDVTMDAIIGGWCIFIYPCSHSVITIAFKINSSGRTQIYQYAPPPPQIIASIVTSLYLILWPTVTGLKFCLADLKSIVSYLHFSFAFLIEACLCRTTSPENQQHSELCYTFL